MARTSAAFEQSKEAAVGLTDGQDRHGRPEPEQSPHQPPQLSPPGTPPCKPAAPPDVGVPSPGRDAMGEQEAWDDLGRATPPPRDAADPRKVACFPHASSLGSAAEAGCPVRGRGGRGLCARWTRAPHPSSPGTVCVSRPRRGRSEEGPSELDQEPPASGSRRTRALNSENRKRT